MGSGKTLRCKKCKRRYTVFSGVGMSFPLKFMEIQQKVRDGEYGSEWKELIRSGDYIVADAETHIYVCDNCSYWGHQLGLSLYEPNDPIKLAGIKYGIKTVGEWGYVPYAMADDFRNGYHLLKERIHRCNKCNSTMHKASEDDEENLKCHDCGIVLRSDWFDAIFSIDWD